jgi:Uma2 family endonuclease
MSTATALDVLAPVPAPAHGESLYEVVKGQRVELPSMGIYAIWLASRLQNRINLFVERGRLGNVVTEALFILDPTVDQRRRPDVAFVSAERWPLDRPLPDSGDWAIVPDLAVEIISPNDLFRNVLAKVREYFEHGVVQVWLVIPSERQIYIYDAPAQVRIVGADGELANTVVPGFALKLADFFQQAM